MAQTTLQNLLSQEQEILQNIELQTKKLGLLLHNSTMPQEIKMSWLSLLPQMSLKQIDRFLNILEAKYLDEQTKSIDKKLKKELGTMIAKFQKQEVKSGKDLIKKIKKLKTKS